MDLLDKEKLCWRREECNRLPCILPLKAHFFESKQLRMPKLTEKPVPEPRNQYQPWILCDSDQREILKSLNILEGKAVRIGCLYIYCCFSGIVVVVVHFFFSFFESKPLIFF